MIPVRKFRGRVSAALLTAAMGAALTGCGGGGSSTPVTTTKKAVPTAATRSRVQNLHNQSLHSLTANGVQSATQANSFNGGKGGSGTTTGGGTSTGSGVSVSSGTNSGSASTNGGGFFPLIGSFIRNVAALPKSTRAAHLTRSARSTRDEKPGASGGSAGNGALPQPASFYFDEYLGLWVQIDETDTKSTYTLFEDEAKTKPAGSIVTESPAFNSTTYPQVYQSTYSFTKGFLDGAHGNYISTLNQDGSGSGSFENFYVDGSKDSGKNTTATNGDYSYLSTSTTADGKTSTSRGDFRADGSGGSHSETSDGYVSDYSYNADGSGRANITGPDPGLPVTITWDASGNTTIRYADGSIETIPAWGGEVVSEVATTSSNGTSTSSANPPPVPDAPKGN